MALFNCIYPWIWYELKKNNEVMVEVDESLITWCSLSCVRQKRDFTTKEILLEHNVKQIWYKNPERNSRR